MGNAYTYYSYEEYGRGYIGARSKSPIGDDAYMGSFKDKSFNPTQKIILAEFSSMEEAIEVEVALHNYFDVAVNPHFANRAKQTTTGWTTAGYSRPQLEEELEKRKKYWSDPENREAQSERLTGIKKKEGHKIAEAYRTWKRAHWTKELWDDVVKALSESVNRNWGAVRLSEKHNVTLKSVKKIRLFILEGVTYEEAVTGMV